jgi:hypothetical protein
MSPPAEEALQRDLPLILFPLVYPLLHLSSAPPPENLFGPEVESDDERRGASSYPAAANDLKDLGALSEKTMQIGYKDVCEIDLPICMFW